MMLQMIRTKAGIRSSGPEVVKLLSDELIMKSIVEVALNRKIKIFSKFRLN
jgi:hypothetical protein